MWKEAPSSVTAGASEHADEPDTDDEDDGSHVHKKGPELRDENGFCYFGPAEKINAYLDVELMHQWCLCVPSKNFMLQVCSTQLSQKCDGY